MNIDKNMICKFHLTPTTNSYVSRFTAPTQKNARCIQWVAGSIQSFRLDSCSNNWKTLMRMMMIHCQGYFMVSQCYCLCQQYTASVRNEPRQYKKYIAVHNIHRRKIFWQNVTCLFKSQNLTAYLIVLFLRWACTEAHSIKILLTADEDIIMPLMIGDDVI